MPWRSIYFEKANADKLLGMGGYPELPMMVPRWERLDEDAYGDFCPGMIALADTKQLQLMHRRKLQALDKSVNPATQGPAGSVYHLHECGHR